MQSSHAITRVCKMATTEVDDATGQRGTAKTRKRKNHPDNEATDVVKDAPVVTVAKKVRCKTTEA